jgi:integrase
MQKTAPSSVQAAVVLFDAFLDWVQQFRSQGTYDWYHNYLQSFSEFLGPKVKLSDLKPHHVTQWISERYAKQKDNTIRAAIRSVQRACNWAVREGYIVKSPVASVEKPQQTRREVYLTPAQWEQMFKLATDDPERDLLSFLREAGCRPQEIRVIEAKHLMDGMVIFPPSEAKGKRRARVIHLTDKPREIVERLANLHPTGPIFRKRKGDPWTRNAIRCRFRKFKEKLGIPDLCSTVIRHVYITDALQNGVDPVSLAELVGHVDLSMIQRHYSHIYRNHEFLKQQAEKAAKN